MVLAHNNFYTTWLALQQICKQKVNMSFLKIFKLRRNVKWLSLKYGITGNFSFLFYNFQVVLIVIIFFLKETHFYFLRDIIIFIKARNRIQCLVLWAFVLTFNPGAQRSVHSLLIRPKRIRTGHAMAGTSICSFRNWEKMNLPCQHKRLRPGSLWVIFSDLV